MAGKQINVYAACDRAIQEMNRTNLAAFGRLKMAKWDEVHIIRTVAEVYRKSTAQARKRYYEVGFEAYLMGMYLCDWDQKEAHELAEKAITEKWVDGILTETDLLTLYRFDTEAERKAYRLAEALEVAQDRGLEIDRALKAWSQQVAQYAINVTDYAMVEAYEDAGITKVEWVSTADERVCGECRSYDGEEFELDEIPTKPHLKCRCWLKPVK